MRRTVIEVARPGRDTSADVLALQERVADGEIAIALPGIADALAAGAADPETALGSLRASADRADNRGHAIVSVLDEGGVGDGSTDNATAIDNAVTKLLTLTDNGYRHGILEFSGGHFYTSETIPRYPWMTIRGAGGGHYSGGETRISATPGFGGDLIASTNLLGIDSEFQHGGGVFDLQVTGENQVSGSGIHIKDTGELFSIDRVSAGGCYAHGIHIEGDSTPTHIGYISVHGNGNGGAGSGVFLDHNLVTANYIEYIAGDNNATALLEIDSLGYAVCHVAAFKAERWGGSPGHPNVFVVNNGNGGTLIVGAGRVHLGGGIADGNAIFRFTGSGGTDPTLVVYGGIEYDTSVPEKYTYEVQTQQAGDEIPWNTFRGRPFTHSYRPPGTFIRSTGGPATTYMRSGITNVPMLAGRNLGDTVDRWHINVRGQIEWGPGNGAVDTNLYRSAANLLKTDDALAVPGTYLLPLWLGSYALWVNPGDGKLYIKSSAPSSATDGTVVGS